MTITGSYDKNRQLFINNENDLHKRVVAWVRRFRPELILIPGLGELQKTDEARMEAWGKGYRKGTPDLLVLNRHKDYRGLAIELKSPNGNGVLSKHQKGFLKQLAQNGYRVLLSNDYDEVVHELERYAQGLVPEDPDTDGSSDEEEQDHEPEKAEPEEP